MRSFITGSHAFGTPNKDSDVDLVVVVSFETMDKLMDLEDDPDQERSPTPPRSVSLRFGNLNMICVARKQEYDLWKKGTEHLIKMKPVTKQFARTYFAELRKENKEEEPVF